MRTVRILETGALVHALLYIRVSGAEHQQEGLSLDYQEKATRAYVASQPGWIIGGEYRDVESGAHDNRASYQALLTEARRLNKRGQRVAVVVVRLDRFGRDLAEQARARKELRKLGCEQHSIKEGGALQDLHAGMLMVFSQHERQLISERVADVRGDLVKDGWAYGRVAFGYRLRPATPEEIHDGIARRLAGGGAPQVFERDPITSSVAAEVFQRIADGETVRSVARWLAALPTEVRGGRNWPHQSVVKMLRSPTYVARPADGDDHVLNRPVARWQAIITDETWASVQARLDGHAVHPHEGAHSRFLLTGFLRCARCGERMVGTSRGGSGRRSGYRCTGGLKGAGAPVADCFRYVTMELANQAVLEQVGALLTKLADPAHWPAYQRAWEALEQPTADTALIGELEREVRKLSNRLANAAALLADGVLDRDGYNALRERETQAIAAAQVELKRLTAAQATVRRTPLPSAQAVFDFAGDWSSILLGVDIPAQRQILDQLVETVTISRTGWRQYEAKITWTRLGERLGEATIGQAA
jgi:DNA invertase Pin-like site-specific DNA recombinase